jgi:TPP-dependent pyruvate/acetoin dehydrogenase alpha subunit
VIAVYQAASEAVRRARAGEGPTLIECKTYRQRAHSEGMREAGYRSPEEVAAWKARCPLVLLRQRLAQEGTVDEAEIERIEAEVKALVEEAARFAEQSPRPDPASAGLYLYSQEGGCHA